ncbi:single-stranded DNA-binding protein [Micrococcaceae bacterium Sec5.7]
MSDNITVRGFVASEIKSSTTPGGVATASFRLGSTDRRFDRASSTWVDGNTNWFTVQGYRQLAGNIGCSIKKGQRVIIVGRLKMRSWEKEGRIYHVAEIDAESVGHDLMWGSANFTRMASNSSQPVAGQAGSADGAEGLTRENADGGPDSADDHGAEDRDESPGIFVDDKTGDRLEVDSETGELTGAAA